MIFLLRRRALGVFSRRWREIFLAVGRTVPVVYYFKS